MTAEVAILNRSAVALAADSVVTIGQGEAGRKTYNTVNKLFELSMVEPVGVMVYGNGTFMDVPWEVIIKIYRDQLETRAFDTVAEYAADFLDFLRRDRSLFPQEQREQMFYNLCLSIFVSFKEHVKQAVSEYIDEFGEMNEKDLAGIVDSTLDTGFEVFMSQPDLEPLDEPEMQAAFDSLERLVATALTDAIQELPLTAPQRKRAFDFCRLAARKEAKTKLRSGIVIAGFGKKEPFPALFSYHLEALIGDWLRLQRDEECHISVTESVTGEGDFPTAAIYPFAQQDVVKTLVNGIDPHYLETMMSAVAETLRRYPDVVTRVVGDEVSPERMAELSTEVAAMGEAIFAEFSQRLVEFTRTYYIAPVLDAVEILPKDELAAMAESLVNLTSFKRKMSLEMETVGEPIDVAVISKGDGFIWIKRKQYFRMETNPQFLAKYSRR